MDMSDIAVRLERKFGLGTRPELRRRLFTRLEDLVEDVGEPAYVCIASAAADAEGKDHPGHYFCRVVTTRLKERGIVSIPDF